MRDISAARLFFLFQPIIDNLWRDCCLGNYFPSNSPYFHTLCGSTYEDHVLRWIVWLSHFLFAFCVKKPEKLWEILQKGKKIDYAPCVRFSWWIRSGKFATNYLVNKLEVFKFVCYFIFWGWVPPTNRSRGQPCSELWPSYFLDQFERVASRRCTWFLWSFTHYSPLARQR